MKTTQLTLLKTSSIIDNYITPEKISSAQTTDPTLMKVRELCNSGKVRGKASFFKKNGTQYRKFTSPKVGDDRVFVQFILPQYRKMVMRLANESIMSAHLAIKGTIQKVLAEFIWPEISSDIKRYCQFCDICQRTLSKGKIIKAH